MDFYWILSVLGVGVMLSAFVILPDDYSWYYEVLLFDVGLACWLFSKWKRRNNNAKEEAGKLRQFEFLKKANWLSTLSAIITLIGALRFFLDSDSILQEPLEIIFFVGALSMLFTARRTKCVLPDFSFWLFLTYFFGLNPDQGSKQKSLLEI